MSDKIIDQNNKMAVLLGMCTFFLLEIRSQCNKEQVAKIHYLTNAIEDVIYNDGKITQMFETGLLDEIEK